MAEHDAFRDLVAAADAALERLGHLYRVESGPSLQSGTIRWRADRFRVSDLLRHLTGCRALEYEPLRRDLYDGAITAMCRLWLGLLSEKPHAAVMLVARRGPAEMMFAGIRSVKRGGALGLLGGKRGPEEHPLDAACREAREEAGVVVESALPLGEWVDEDGHLTAGFLAEEFHTEAGDTETLRSSPEGEATWVSRAELLGSGAAFPEWNQRVLEVYDRQVAALGG